MDAEVKKLENEIKEAIIVEKSRMVRQGAYSHIDKLESYRRELVSLLLWLGPHIAKCSDQGSTLQKAKCAMSIVTIKGGDSSGTMMEDWMELYKGGVAT